MHLLTYLITMYTDPLSEYKNFVGVPVGPVLFSDLLFYVINDIVVSVINQHHSSHV